MPIYTFHCPSCHHKDDFILPVTAYDQPQPCPLCFAPMDRLPPTGVGGFVH